MESLREIIKQLVYEKLKKQLEGSMGSYDVLGSLIRLQGEKEPPEIECETTLLTEDRVREITDSGTKDILIGQKCLVTPLATDYIRENQLRLRRAGDMDGHW